MLESFEFRGIRISTMFGNKVNVLLDDSTVDHRFLFTAMRKHCDMHKIPYSYLTPEHPSDSFEGKNIVLLEQADSYLTPELLRQLKSLNAFSVVSVQNTKSLDMSGDIGRYFCINHGEQINIANKDEHVSALSTALGIEIDPDDRLQTMSSF